MSQLTILRVNWKHTKSVEEWLRENAVGRTLNLCCGKSMVGEERVDILPPPKSSATKVANLFKLEYPPGSWDTVICDPPFSYYNRFKWIQHMAIWARKRLLISSPPLALSNFLPRFDAILWAFPRSGYGMFLRLYWQFDRLDGIIDPSGEV